jgi:hypothetical protein
VSAGSVDVGGVLLVLLSAGAAIGMLLGGELLSAGSCAAGAPVAGPLFAVDGAASDELVWAYANPRLATSAAAVILLARVLRLDM